MLYGLVVVVVTVVGLEVLARVVWALTVGASPSAPGDSGGIGPGGLSQSADYTRDIPYRFRPNQSGAIADTFVHTNNLGFRGTRPTLKKRPGQFRIVCVGDSVTFGYNATSDEKAYPAVLQRLFDREGADVEVVNAGMPGFESWHVAAFVKKVVLAADDLGKQPSLETDLVLVEFGWNDARQFAPPPEPRRPSVWQRIAGGLYLVRLPARFLEVARAGDPEWEDRAARALIERVRNGPPQRDTEAEQLYRDSLEQIVEACQANGVEVMLVAPPNFLETDLDDAAWRKCASHFAGYPTLSFAGWQAMVRFMVEANRTVADQYGVAFLDTASLADATLFADICHPNDEGNERLAHWVFRALVDRKLAPGPATEGDRVEPVPNRGSP